MRASSGVGLLVLASACGTPPEPRPVPHSAPLVVSEPPPRDPCEPVDGKPPQPLDTTYTGVLRDARCQPEVLAIMQSISRALGTGCDHCHDEMNFGAPTPNKRVANWMASELMPRLAKRAGGAITCADCHADDGHGKTKILGAPRSRQRAIEWMTANLVERFEQARGGPLYCKTCHVGQVGTSAFVGHVILTDHLPPLPASAAPRTPAAASASATPSADGAGAQPRPE